MSDGSRTRWLSQPHCLYRWFDEDWELLYIGMTSQIGVRPYNHFHSWTAYAHTLVSDGDWGPRREVAQRELRAIRTEHPIFNYFGITHLHDRVEQYLLKRGVDPDEAWRVNYSYQCHDRVLVPGVWDSKYNTDPEGRRVALTREMRRWREVVASGTKPRGRL